MDDIQPLDLGDRADANANVRARRDFLEKARSGGGVQALRIINVIWQGSAIQNHGGGNNRSGPGAAPCLVDSANRAGEIGRAFILDSPVGRHGSLMPRSPAAIKGAPRLYPFHARSRSRRLPHAPDGRASRSGYGPALPADRRA